jgi:hypothetical protein
MRSTRTINGEQVATKVYIAGPMTHIPHFNFPAFHAAADDLRSRGFEVVSPAELDSSEAKKAAEESVDGDPGHYAKNDSWGTMLARDVLLIADEGIEAIVVLPGWERSRGAKLETYVARLCDVPILEYPTLGQVHLDLIDAAHGHDGAYSKLMIATMREQDSVFKPDEYEDVESYSVAWNRIAEARKEAGVAPGEPLLGLNLPEGPEDDSADLGRLAEIDASLGGFAHTGGETRITDPTTGGQKGSKLPQFGALDPDALITVAEVAGFGASKYERLNYLRGFNWSLAYDALQRHIHEFWAGREIDEESGLPHTAHATWQCLCLLSFALHDLGNDDRICAGKHLISSDDQEAYDAHCGEPGDGGVE